MMETAPVEEVVRALLTLPPERVTEVRDFVLFLQSRYGQAVDMADAWTDADIRDLVAASLTYADESSADTPDDPTG